VIIVDTALEQRERDGEPIRVGLVGAGYMGRGIALEILTPIAGMRLVAIANRTVARAVQAYRDAGVDPVRVVESPAALERAIAGGEPAVTDNPTLLCQAAGIDVIIECTGAVDFGAGVAMDAIRNGKHLVLVNCELDATVGPMLKVHADRAGVVITNTDGDEPGVAMNLYRFVKMLGYRPVAAGNLKGLIDPYRTPDTQRAFAEKAGQDSRMITSYADGTKLSMEATILANATGFGVARRGMYGYRCGHVRDAVNLFSIPELLDGGLVDYLLGAEPHTGAFVLGYADHPVKQHYLRCLKMGDGPLYAFYTPYHLPHLQVISTVARAVLFKDATVAPRGEPMCDVLSVAKRDLHPGDVLDGIGGFTAYGVIDHADVVARARLLPIGLAEGCRLTRALRRDEPITYDDVQLPEGRLVDGLRADQATHFNTPALAPAASIP
jgi:predicted homoserine dehydrogenase-like protein